ncbi:MAG: transporter substrate-binding domain-containing protein [Ruminococcaceae bacterium]|nr:transporter substrate-binding domain-containing protein [Oscillospiraceae bacterium]
MKKVIRIISAAMALALIFSLAACGKSGEKTYVVATDTTFAPFEFTDASGKFVGIDVDILAAVAEDQGFKYELKSLGFDAAVAALESNQADGVIAGMSITDTRKEKYDFSSAYYDSGVVIAVNGDSATATIDDLKGKTIAVKNGTEGATYAESIKDEYGLTLTYFDDSALMYQEGKTGGAAACVEDYPVMGYGISQGNGLKMIGDMVQGSSYGFAVMKGKNAELLTKFETGLQNIIKNGKYQEILDKYIAKA